MAIVPDRKCESDVRRDAVTLATSIVALVPFLVLSTAEPLFRRQLVQPFATTDNAMAVASGVSLAAYAFGAMLAGDLAQRFRQRRLFLICETGFVAACAIAAVASSMIGYATGLVLQGFATGLLLIIALPPVIRSFPAEYLSISAAAIDLGFFGAITAGPPIGGVVAALHGWRWFYGALGATGLLVAVSGYFVLPDKPPPKPDLPFDAPAITLAFVATFLPFWGANELTGHAFGSPLVAGPLAIGLACFVALLLTEYHRREPLSPVEPMWTTLPIVGVGVAMIGGAAFVAFTLLVQQDSVEVLHGTPLSAGVSLWPMIIGAVIASIAVGAALKTRWLAPLTGLGLGSLIVGGWLLLGVVAGQSSSGLAAVLLGVGAGASVAPGLWLASLSLPSSLVGRAFAVVELVRSEADFIAAPVLLKIAQGRTGAGLRAAGVSHALVVMIAITAALSAGCVILYLMGGPGLQRPRLNEWLKRDRPAFESPRLGETVRGRSKADA